MKSIFRWLLIGSLVLTIGLEVSAYAADFYVSKEKGDNQNSGTSKQSPFKNLESALKTAKAGDRIFVAQGNYTGLRDKGYLEAPQPVELLGGYSSDFAVRDVIKYSSTIIPGRESGESGRRPLLSILNVPAGSNFILDGFVFDRGEQNAYSPKDGLIDGLGGRLLYETEKPATGPSTVAEPIICFTNKVNAKIEGNLTISNCVFLNGHFAIQGGFKKGTVKIINNIFIANKMAAIEIYGIGGKKGPRGPIAKDGHVEIANNTILFTWSRLKDFADMGYGIRVMTMASYDIHDNLIGGNILTGVDHTRGNLNEWLKLDHNILFLNKQAPLLYVEPGKSAAGKMERVQIENIGADLGFASCKGNSDKVPQSLPINKTYLENFLRARYSESADYNPNSSANVMREVMGLPKQGKLATRVSMYANRYPLKDAYKLFGAIGQAGAQKPK
jgi:hypothetical protein